MFSRRSNPYPAPTTLTMGGVTRPLLGDATVDLQGAEVLRPSAKAPVHAILLNLPIEQLVGGQTLASPVVSTCSSGMHRQAVLVSTKLTSGRAVAGAFRFGPSLASEWRRTDDRRGAHRACFPQCRKPVKTDGACRLAERANVTAGP
jgi:hypothetical protein